MLIATHSHTTIVRTHLWQIDRCSKACLARHCDATMVPSSLIQPMKNNLIHARFFKKNLIYPSFRLFCSSAQNKASGGFATRHLFSLVECWHFIAPRLRWYSLAPLRQTSGPSESYQLIHSTRNHPSQDASTFCYNSGPAFVWFQLQFDQETFVSRCNKTLRYFVHICLHCFICILLFFVLPCFHLFNRWNCAGRR